MTSQELKILSPNPKFKILELTPLLRSWIIFKIYLLFIFLKITHYTDRCFKGERGIWPKINSEFDLKQM